MQPIGTDALLTPAERVDLESQARVLARLRVEVDDAIGLAVLEPGVWHSPARDACAVRVAELRGELGTLSARIDEAAALVRYRLHALDATGSPGAG
ncbi:hypothetical protein [Leifsonia sp. Leaf264]|uniref:hypothetical protein n=1 Tax=Leifsonia sp. Leaf264 TaxID=1736314 RepID=UPI0006F4D680|nr:hypothetical protein [Leifsonia sp. Leaf264]KQO95760.1 hypothetical protein ASF30_19290 [Leifsonia sp. Leaf264]